MAGVSAVLAAEAQVLSITDWRARGVERAKRAFGQASSTSDRLALLRSWVRLADGRLDPGDEGIALSASERKQLPRFGLSEVETGGVIRLMDEADAPGPSGLAAAMRLDSRPRQVFDAAPPDAPLLRLTEHVEYRSAAQKAAVRALLTQPPGTGLMVSLPTGSGKSLLFQMAALGGRSAQPGACVLVITPTIALALDHQRTLAGISGLESSRALTGDTPAAEGAEIVNAFRRGEIPILLLSPEKALNPALTAQFVEAATPSSVLHGLDARLTHLFVDEAHIVESWGRSFRPDFQRLPGLLAALRGVNSELRAVLLSATLPPSARRVLKRGWSFGAPWLEVDARTPRYEHDVVVASYVAPATRDGALAYVVDRVPRPAIIYATKVDEAQDLYDRLRVEGGYRRIAVFTGETPPAQRRQIVLDWSDDRLDLVVATSAFGMGIDKANVRSVIHACLPEGAARWYQEVGRAARDGGQGLAVCLFTDSGYDSDVEVAKDLAVTGLLSRDKAEPRWTALLDKATEGGWSEGRRRLRLDLDAVREGNFPRSGDYNRGWNRTLLTLMQRAGVLEVLSVSSEGDQPGFNWDIAILEPRILASDNTEVWDHIFRVRDEERAEARATFAPFLDLMRKPERVCVTRGAFELIEPQAMVPACGRCPACRSRGQEAPSHLPSGGMEAAWRDARPAPLAGLPAGVLLLDPEDPDLESGAEPLLRRLGAAGFDQFIVPRSQAAIAASTLSASGVGLGLVLAAEDWLAELVPARLHTAVLLPHESRLAAQVASSLKRQSVDWPETTWLVVCRPSQELGGRRLDQTLSASAPLPENVLDDLVRSPSEAP